MYSLTEHHLCALIGLLTIKPCLLFDPRKTTIPKLSGNGHGYPNKHARKSNFIGGQDCFCGSTNVPGVPFEGFSIRSMPRIFPYEFNSTYTWPAAICFLIDSLFVFF